MQQGDVKSGKKPYRVVQIEGRITWRIEELWEGGVVRQPYGSRDNAVKHEEGVARQNGFIDDLVLQETATAAPSPLDSFRKDAAGNWRCVAACAIDIENKEIVFSEGSSFTKGAPFMGVDVARWLDEHAAH
jgi:hypothetical protein